MADKDYFETQFKALKQTMVTNKEEVIRLLKQNIESLEKKVKERDEKIANLEERVEHLENRQRIANIEIRNFPETKEEDVFNIVKRIGLAIGVEGIKEGDIQMAHRVNSKSVQKGRGRPIIAHLASRFLRNKWLEQHKKFRKEKGNLKAKHVSSRLPDTDVYIQEHITVNTKLLLGKVKAFAKEKAVKFVWIKEGFILIKKNEQDKEVVKIGSKREFLEYKQKHFPV